MEVPGILSLLLMDVEEFQARTVRIQVAKMDGITMSEPYGREHLAVIVERCRAPDYLVTSITVHITYGDIMVAVGIHRVASHA